ncbi:MAG TPA: hypothetical protein VF245_00820 [Solirubrobacterales bacterium]
MSSARASFSARFVRSVETERKRLAARLEKAKERAERKKGNRAAAAAVGELETLLAGLRLLLGRTEAAEREAGRAAR